MVTSEERWVPWFPEDATFSQDLARTLALPLSGGLTEFLT